MADEEYELAPHKKLEMLRQDVERLKQNPLAGTKQSKDLLSSMDRLTSSVHMLIDMFRVAGEEMKREHHTEKFSPKLLMERLDDIEKQNKIIAEGMVSISDMVKKAHQKPELPPMPPPQAMPQPEPFRISTAPAPPSQDYAPYPPQGPSPFQSDFNAPFPPPEPIPRLQSRSGPMGFPPNPLDAPAPPPDFRKRSLFGR
ncbi:MAG: hypothetical protein ABIH34_03650 [Nanoarchaeota archaeon]